MIGDRGFPGWDQTFFVSLGVLSWGWAGVLLVRFFYDPLALSLYDLFYLLIFSFANLFLFSCGVYSVRPVGGESADPVCSGGVVCAACGRVVEPGRLCVEVRYGRMNAEGVIPVSSSGGNRDVFHWGDVVFRRF